MVWHACNFLKKMCRAQPGYWCASEGSPDVFPCNIPSTRSGSSKPVSAVVVVHLPKCLEILSFVHRFFVLFIRCTKLQVNNRVRSISHTSLVAFEDNSLSLPLIAGQSVISFALQVRSLSHIAVIVAEL